MPWCPKCKNEYVEGIKVCADCGVALVDSLEGMKRNPLIFGEREQMERLKDFLQFNGIDSADLACDEDGMYELCVNDAQRQKAASIINVFLKEEEAEEAKKLMPEIESDIPERPAVPVFKGVYQDSAKKAEENRSSAYLLLTIGGIGLALMILIFTDIIRIPLAAMNKYMTCGVMSGLFILFIVMGITSMKSSKALAKKAESENSLSGELKKWCGENLTAEIVDEDCGEGENREDEAEEIKYFKRVEKMKQMISHQFMNLDEDFLDSFVDDYYPVIFEQESKIS